MKFILHIYFLILPVILGGVLNMIFIKLPILKTLQVPMDGGKVLRDGNRIFGNNKTWKGFLGMTLLSAFSAWLVWNQAFQYSFFFGAWLGFAYALFELPNSFIKRRFNIQAGKNGGAIQTFFDQADSVIGCIVLLPLIYPLTWQEALGIFVIGTLTHYVMNALLFFAKLRGQRG